MATAVGGIGQPTRAMSCWATKHSAASRPNGSPVAGSAVHEPADHSALRWPGRIERLVGIDLAIVIGEQVGSAGELGRGGRDRGREPSPRSRSATFAILRRASGGPHRDPSSGPGESPIADEVPRVSRCGHHTQRGRVVDFDAPDRLDHVGPLEPAPVAGVVDVDDRRAMPPTSGTTRDSADRSEVIPSRVRRGGRRRSRRRARPRG